MTPEQIANEWLHGNRLVAVEELQKYTPLQVLEVVEHIRHDIFKDDDPHFVFRRWRTFEVALDSLRQSLVLSGLHTENLAGF